MQAATVIVMPNGTDYTVGYLIGTAVAALGAAFVLMWLIGVVRGGTSSRPRSGLDYSLHYRTLWLAALLYAVALLGRFVVG